LRWGIPDVETWLQSIEPRVIDAWLAFERVEPEAFEERRAEPAANRGSQGGRMIDAREAAQRLASRVKK